MAEYQWTTEAFLPACYLFSAEPQQYNDYSAAVRRLRNQHTFQKDLRYIL